MGCQHADCTCEPDLSEWLGGWFGISLPFHIWMALKFCFQVVCGGLRPSERVDVNEIKWGWPLYAGGSFGEVTIR